MTKTLMKKSNCRISNSVSGEHQLHMKYETIEIWVDSSYLNII